MSANVIILFAHLFLAYRMEIYLCLILEKLQLLGVLLLSNINGILIVSWIEVMSRIACQLNSARK